MPRDVPLGDFPPCKTCFQLVIEHDQPLTRALLDAGATLRHSIAHMEGPLPAAPAD